MSNDWTIKASKSNNIMCCCCARCIMNAIFIGHSFTTIILLIHIFFFVNLIKSIIFSHTYHLRQCTMKLWILQLTTITHLRILSINVLSKSYPISASIEAFFVYYHETCLVNSIVTWQSCAAYHTPIHLDY